MKDDAGVVQIWSVSPRGGDPVPLTRNPFPVTSAFTWSPDGRLLAYVMDRSVWVTEVGSGASRRLTAASGEADAPRTEACVFSPDGRRIAFVRNLAGPDGTRSNQICVVTL
jgi:Tol biopolymer transport system component